MEKQGIGFFLLGKALITLEMAQDQLVQDKVKEGLRIINDSLKDIQVDLEKHFYKKESEING